ncbi:MAG: DUF2336 domain-containing protein [Rhodopseudomonas palustris]|uniref:DUF2336 domain-containing protein n=1 Tax=Rhodopseudomonas palustris TaxID=1076 RepID=A0A933RX94_RHOPL|nr:DUF2336 domain-containing protein [Rhodopseudomonas palustris]
MSTAFPLPPELDDVVDRGTPERRAEVVRRIADLFVQGAARFNAGHVQVFDGVLLRLLPEAEAEAELRSELARRFCSLGNAPPALIGQLVQDEDIAIAGPLLRRSSQIADDTLAALARSRGQTHLMAITERTVIAPPITDVIVRRGDREVLRAIALNTGAEFSSSGFDGLIRRAAQDGVLAAAVGARDDLSAPRLKDLLASSAESVRRKLIEAATPNARIAINRVLRELAGEPTQPVVKRDFAPAQRAIVTLHHRGDLGEEAVLDFARAFQYEETVAALSAMSGVRIATLDPLIAGERHDPMLMLGKALGFGWITVRAMIGLQLGPDRMPASPDVEEARQNFEQLAPQAAQRVVGFWKMRPSVD